jgi:hypothetical protein
MLTVAAPVTVQLSVEDSPDEMLAGLALKELITGSWLGPVIVIGPPVQLAINITASRSKGTSFFMFHLLI